MPRHLDHDEYDITDALVGLSDVFTPAIPARVRTIAYFVLLALSAVVLCAQGLAPIWLDPDTADQVVRTAGVVTGVAGLIAGGLGVTYRPTR
jgi:uncharacterized membrane protein HdeD (DUF308 family)